MGSDSISISPQQWEELLGVGCPKDWPSAISGVQSDSRRIRPGMIFVAVPGQQADGYRYIEDAIQRGAVGVVSERNAVDDFSIPGVQVESARKVLALISRAFFRSPDQHLRMIGVTGTNGKSSVVRFVRHYLERTGTSVGSLGTVGYSFGGREIPARRTTPDSPDLFQLLSDMVRADCSTAVMEVSSHALDQFRVGGVEFDIVVFTNLSQDHLDYHLTMEAYFEAKSRLFEMAPGAMKVVGEDSWSERLAERFGPEVIRCGFGENCDVRAEVVEMTLAGSVANVTTPWGSGILHSPLPGMHNLRNTLQALAVVAGCGVEIQQLLTATETLEAAPGRLQLIPGAVGRVYVDYAHTPDALENVLELVSSLATGKVKVVFGCGGDRDRTKRPLMVEAAAKFADEILLTQDNPRTEDPGQIIEDMKKGIPSGDVVEVELDREQAFRKAIESLEKGDVLILAGKGHETIQEIGSLQIPFDDREVARRILAERDAALLEDSSVA